MALMIPADVDQFKTPGEKQFYHFLQAVGKPDTKHIAWYTPDIDGKEPDFLLFSSGAGIVVFEVKDWALNQIMEADSHNFTLQVGRKFEKRKNPLQQAREYLYDLMDTITKDGHLLSNDPAFVGKPKIPFGSAVVFPNINKLDYIKKGFDRIIPTELAFFWDDLHPDSEFWCDTSGHCFINTIQNKFQAKFNFTLKDRELDHLKRLIFPTVKIELPERGTEDDYPQRINRLEGLDHHQEVLARKFDGGHRIITGPSGSGKTLILVHKAAFLKKYNPEIKNILFVCYNITLTNYIKRLLSNKQVPLGEGGVTVKHFFELCSEIIGQDLAYEKEEPDYYDIIVQEALEKGEDFGRTYNAILVDEGQDLSDDMYRVLVALLNKKTNNLTISLDENQNIYKRRTSWKDLGIQARGRIHNISCVYRNTREITSFANRFIQSVEPDKDQSGKGKQKELFPDFFDFSGPKPEICQFKSIEEIVEYAVTKTKEIAETDQCPYSEIAVLYAMKNPGKNLKTPLPEMIESAMESKGILSRWVSENYRSKKTHDITTNSVTISTIHSVKGLDYSAVFLLGLDFLEPHNWSVEQIERLIYVAITRARYQLFIP